MPGFVDAHCHLRDPGFEYREDIVTGTRSAAHGEVYFIACMLNTKPVCDNAAVVSYIVRKNLRQKVMSMFSHRRCEQTIAGKNSRDWSDEGSWHRGCFR